MLCGTCFPNFPRTTYSIWPIPVVVFGNYLHVFSNYRGSSLHLYQRTQPTYVYSINCHTSDYTTCSLNPILSILPAGPAWLFHITRIPQFNSLRTSIINGVGWPPEKKLKEIPQKCLHSVKAKYFIDTHMPTPHRIANPLRTTEPPNHPSSQSTSDLIRMLTTAGDGEKRATRPKTKGSQKAQKIIALYLLI